MGAPPGRCNDRCGGTEAMSDAPSKVMLLALTAEEVTVLRVALEQLVEDKQSDNDEERLKELLARLPVDGPPPDASYYRPVA